MRSDRSQVNECEAYGYRPLCHTWKLLSPYEFGRYWRVVPSLIPTYYKNRGKTSWTKWTAEGIQLIKSQEYEEGKVSAKSIQSFLLNIFCSSSPKDDSESEADASEEEPF